MARLLIGNIKGPKGDKGDTGTTGPQGKQGAQGVQGAKGDVGLPALVMKKSLVGEYPVGSTFTGNVSEWLNRTPLANEYSTALSGGGKYSIVWQCVSQSGSLFTGKTISRQSIIGAQGPKGATGATGPTGPQGPIGPTGPIGATGATGPQGKQGAQGVQGAKGDVGLPALVMKKSLVGEYPVGSTFTGNVSEWLNRTPLANEYSTALSGGGKYSIVWQCVSQSGSLFTGKTISRQSIIGAQGPKGATGATGPTGPQGPIGPTGPIGATGATGPQGKQGAQGVQGMQGPQGPSGPQGASGVTAPASGFFTLQVDPNGDLYAVYADTATASEAPVSYDPATGDLYYTINDGK